MGYNVGMRSPKDCKILIVEDDKSTRDALVEKFKLEGFMVVPSVDGEDGLNKVRTEKPDLILLDMLMPKKSGKEMFEELIHEPAGLVIPVIMLTNDTSAKDIFDSGRSGITDYIIKSETKIEEVITKVKEHLNIE